MRLVRCGALLLLPFLLTYGQNPYGRVTGRVTDSAGALVPGASVRAINVDTNVPVAAATNADGNYDIPNLVPGNYRIESQKQGFKTSQRGPMEVRVGDVLSVDIRLELGAIAESVTVTGEAPLVEFASANLGQVIDNRSLVDLPMAGANPNYLVQMVPGMMSTNAPTHGWLPQAHDSISDLGANGTRTRSSEFTLDGVPNMQQLGQINIAPPPEMLQEFRVQTAPYDASVGHFTGAQINMVLKSGTNQLHGNAVFSHVSRPLMSVPFFTNKFIYDPATGPITQEKKDKAFLPVRTQRYRFSAGGPVILPRIYNGRNRTFWTYGFDVLQRQPAIVGSYTVPTVAERNGDFSALLAIGGQYQMYDPTTTTPAATAGRFTRLPLAGNIVPASRIDPIARKLLNYYPLPNTPGTVDFRNNYASFSINDIHYSSHLARIDHMFSERNHFYGSLSQSFIKALQNSYFNNDAAGTLTNARRRQLALSDVITLRPDLIVELRYGLARSWPWNRPVSQGFDLGAAGFPASLVNQLDPKLTSLPELAVGGFSTIGAAGGNLVADTFHNFSGTVSHVRGTHTMRFGADYRVLMENINKPGYVSPHFDFDGSWTRGPMDNSTAAPVGAAMVALLYGLPTGGYIDRNTYNAEKSAYFGTFFQDDWKVTRKLTVTAGLRYEVEVPTTERFNRMNRGFAFDVANPIQAAAQASYAKAPIPEIAPGQFRTSGGLLFAGVGGVPRNLWNTDGNNFAPRIGIAYQIGPKMALRAGYGIFFDTMGADRVAITQQGFNQRTSMTPSLDNGQTFRATLANPFPDGLLQPAGAAAGLNTYLGRAPAFFLPDRRTGYMQRWSFNVQRELPSRVLVEVGYVANRGTGLGVGEEYDATPAKYLSKSPVRDQATIDYLTTAVTNPFYGMPEFTGSNLQGKTVERQQLLRPYPEFTSITSTNSIGFSWYHSLQVRAEKRFSRGFTMQAAYTWSKFMEALDQLNTADLALTKAISPQDRPQHFNVTASYQLPFGRGKALFSTANGLVDRIIGGWSVQGIYQAQSGPPIGFGNILFYGDVHDIVLPRDQRTIERWFNTDAGFEKDSRKALANNLRTFPLRLTGLRADGFNDWDLSVLKNIRLKERLTFQLRIEAQDAFNHAMFSPPNNVPTSTLFGVVSSTIFSEQRRISVGGKLNW